MKHPILTAVIAVALLATPPASALNDPPNLLHFQARLADSVGTALNGPVSLLFLCES